MKDIAEIGGDGVKMKSDSSQPVSRVCECV